MHCKNAVRYIQPGTLGHMLQKQEIPGLTRKQRPSIRVGEVPSPHLHGLLLFAGKEKTAPGFLSAVPKDTISKGRKEKKGQGVTVCFLIWALEYL